MNGRRVHRRDTYLEIHSTVPHLTAMGGGSTVVVSSINGTRTFTTPGARHGIRITALCPGEIETNIEDNTSLRDKEEMAIPVVWPEGQVPITGSVPGCSEDVAQSILFPVSDKARHITGSPFWIDGGQGLLP
jgi:Dehydrogenases with different specificities (related to short-chain alcohol dehydrogenases)